jgi:hypothetical protein
MKNAEYKRRLVERLAARGSDSKPVEKVVVAQPIVRIKRLKSIAVWDLVRVSDSQMSRRWPQVQRM